MLVLTKLCKLTPHQRGREITQYVARLAFGLPPRSGFVQPVAAADVVLEYTLEISEQTEV
jgi:hypothetical protein